MVSTSENCQTFIASVIKFLLQSEFNRLDFDWEYPGSHGTPPQDKHLTTILVQLSHVLYHFDRKAYNQSPILVLWLSWGQCCGGKIRTKTLRKNS
uniref:GH18 domain-containing protein n=1 Tax=Ursus maritimus TaxID=29073 RepID=A0A452UD10_URSMA